MCATLGVFDNKDIPGACEESLIGRIFHACVHPESV